MPAPTWQHKQYEICSASHLCEPGSERDAWKRMKISQKQKALGLGSQFFRVCGLGEIKA